MKNIKNSLYWFPFFGWVATFSIDNKYTDKLLLNDYYPIWQSGSSVTLGLLFLIPL